MGVPKYQKLYPVNTHQRCISRMLRILYHDCKCSLYHAPLGAYHDRLCLFISRLPCSPTLLAHPCAAKSSSPRVILERSEGSRGRYKLFYTLYRKSPSFCTKIPFAKRNSLTYDGAYKRQKICYHISGGENSKGKHQGDDKRRIKCPGQCPGQQKTKRCQNDTQ